MKGENEMANIFDDFDLDIESVSGGFINDDSRSKGGRSGCGCPDTCEFPTGNSTVLVSNAIPCPTYATCFTDCNCPSNKDTCAYCDTVIICTAEMP